MGGGPTPPSQPCSIRVPGAGVPNGDVVVEASAQQHLALRTELQAGEAFGNRLRFVRLVLF